MVQRYLLIGSGGTGTHILDPLLRYLTTHHEGSDPTVWQFGVMDGDAIEAKNLERQLFDPTQILMNKAAAAVKPHQHMGNVLAITEYLGPHNIAQYFSDGIVVFIAVDNFKVRALIEQFCLTLPNSIVINGGNEKSTGSCQIWIRRDGENQTPPLSFLHPELATEDGDRSEMSCEEIAKLPGGEQIIAVNAFSAIMMLTALVNVHQDKVAWTETQFDLFSGTMIKNGESIPAPISVSMDNRELRGWRAEGVAQ